VLLPVCEIPTDDLIVEQGRQVPEETTPGVDDAVRWCDRERSDFNVSVGPVSSSETLGDLCGVVCSLVNNLVVPVPSFNGSFTSSQSLPTDVISTTIAGRFIEVEVTNGFTFDPLSDGGTIAVDVTNGAGGLSLGRITLDGATYVMTPGSPITRTLALVIGTLNGQLAATTTGSL